MNHHSESTRQTYRMLNITDLANHARQLRTRANILQQFLGSRHAVPLPGLEDEVLEEALGGLQIYSKSEPPTRADLKMPCRCVSCSNSFEIGLRNRMSFVTAHDAGTEVLERVMALEMCSLNGDNGT